MIAPRSADGGTDASLLPPVVHICTAVDSANRARPIADKCNWRQRWFTALFFRLISCIRLSSSFSPQAGIYDMTRPSAARVGLSQPPARRGRSSRNQGASSISSAAGRRSSDHVSSDRQQQQRGQSGKHNSRQIQEYEGKDEEEGTEEELDEEEEELDEEDGEEEEDQRRNRPTSRGHREVTADDEDDENEKGENDDIQVKKIRKIQIDDKTRTFLKKLDRKVCSSFQFRQAPLVFVLHNADRNMARLIFRMLFPLSSCIVAGCTQESKRAGPATSVL